MNSVIDIKPAGTLAHTQASGRMAVADIISHVANVQEVMRAVMKPEIHFGKIPGAGDRLTLFKPGAEVLCMAFRIADSYVVEDLSTEDKIRYRVTCIGTHQITGTVLGSGMGEAMTSEEKYKWRKAICTEEFEATPAILRRKKFAKVKGSGFYMQEQVRTEQDDLANTVLKMANKRAKIAMTINVTACGDMFGQDLEDMDEALRDHLARRGEEHHATPPPAPAPTALPDFTEDDLTKRMGKISEFYKAGKTSDEIIAFYSQKSLVSDAMKNRIRAIGKDGVVDAKIKTDADQTPPATPAEHADFVAAMEGDK